MTEQQKPTEQLNFELRKKEAKTVRKVVTYTAIALLSIGLLISAILFFYVKGGLKAYDAKDDSEITVEIPIGSGLTLISKKLEEAGVIKDARIFKYYAKFNNESQFQAGTYNLTKSMTPDELIESLKTGKVYRTPVFTMTIPEGLTIEQIGEVVEKNTTITKDEFVSYVNNPETVDRMMELYPNIVTEEVKNEQIRTPLEGYLFPATYPFYEENPTVEEIVLTMMEGTAMNVTPYLDYLESKGKTVHWLLTFASLLEREATAAADRESIASVFYNRLEADMPLQTDPTVLYALGEHKDRVLYKDLEVQNPYNTYQNKGLPPGPIAAPGRSSIEAVTDPADTNYLYFLADKDGNNHFTDSYEQHLINRDKYITGTKE
ncbi:endolytic transglycosylase MltG [Savagea sp. SN6]|uniref:Endolytic murein transglycosylase n=1 Tax=Savagea serpentis TaxID=2785297 RepID=A0A8J7KKK9_9BACL|nr:endolytic transglycosylase MltG [Savagea serpentis]MBF4500134.1 endolytic transglycosylase MltG [Savagea serpentis]